MKKFISVLAFLLATSAVLAVPAKPVKRVITLSDGTQKEVTLRGDEFAHYWADAEGRMYRQQGSTFVAVDAQSVLRQHAQRRQRAERTRKAPAFGNPQRATYKGKKKGIVILAQFNDLKMKYSKADYQDYFNKAGYSVQGMKGSVRDYFLDCSYGKFDLSFDVIGPVTLSKSVTYYGENDISGNDKHPGEMVREAVQLAIKQGANFKDYDWDGDRLVDQVYVIYAGYGEAQYGPEYTIWPHEYDLYSSAYYGDGDGMVYTNGVYVNTYACSCELQGNTGQNIDGIGTACHEFSHCLGIPDLYDPNYQNFGMGWWDLMDSGAYSGDGKCPTGYTSYERWFAGWLTPAELKVPASITDMKPLDVQGEAYVIYNAANKDEYYLLENRQQTGWFSDDYGHGLLVLHVDYDKDAWEQNTVNADPQRQRVTLIPADNILSDYTLAGDPFPGYSRKSELSNTSIPAAKLYRNNTDGRKYLNHSLTNIRENVGQRTLSFDFDGGKVPDALQQVNADPDANGRTYNLQGVEVNESTLRGGLYIRGGKVHVK